jgi:uncharacterized secreted protein with C-terminal beta-propeller domain
MKRRISEMGYPNRSWWRMPMVAVAGASLLLGACGGDERERVDNNVTPPVATTQFTLMPATSCEDIRDRYIDTAVEEILKYRYSGGWGPVRGGAEFDGAPAAPEADRGAEAPAPSDFTETNVQEVGVDEPDIVKTDGRHIYTVHNSSLVILKSWPAEETDIIGRFDFGEVSEANYYRSVYPSSLFLRGDRVAVFSHVYEYGRRTSSGAPTPDGEDRGDWGEVDYNNTFYGTRINILDVSDRTAPRLEHQLDIEGWMVSARMIDGKVYLVSNSEMRVPVNIWDYTWGEHEGLPAQDWNADEARQNALREQARPVLRELIAAQMADVDIVETMPRRRIGNANGEIIATASLYDCTDLYLPQQVAQMGLLNISSFTLDDKTLIDSTGLMANGWLIYASKDNLYVSMTSRSWWWWGWGNNKNESHIHKFGLPAGNARPQYAASGRVDGWLLNQFSMSEHNGYLRVATTDNQWSWDEASGEGQDSGGNHMIVLKQVEGLLEETGSVRDLAPTERIYSARMMGDKGYMVTFRETDPLYTFDLSDPYDPKMLGELKIEGYSSYMHPMGENHLLAIGMDGDERGVMSGVHLQVFDVSDMANPTRTHHHVISSEPWSSGSEALWNHHAFTYHAGHKVLAVPMTIYSRNGEDTFTGLMVFQADAENGFTEIGRVSHGDLVRNDWCERYDREWECSPEGSWAWWSQMRRSIFMSGQPGEDFVYSLSTVGLKVNELFAPENEVAAVLLR